MAETTSRRGLVFALARVTIELDSPLSIGAGRGDDVIDSLFVLDANGLPAIPGTSLAGVLRAAVRGTRGEEAEREIFGFQEHRDGAPSAVELSWGSVHDRGDKPVPARSDADLLLDDPVLAFLKAGVLRDHVRIGHRGVADEGGKFDMLVVPAGARFTFELVVHGTTASGAQKELRDLLGIFAHAGLRLGGRSRSGLGAVRVVRCRARSFDLREAADRAAFRSLPRALRGDAGSLDAVDVTKLPKPALPLDTLEIRLRLTPEDLWIFGTGRPVRDEHLTARKDDAGADRKPHDRVPLTERRIRWAAAGGTVERDEEAGVLVPASGIKGALRHRALFHARRRSRQWALASAPEDGKLVDESLQEYARWADHVRAQDGTGDPWPDLLARDVDQPAGSPAEEAIDQLFGWVKGRGGGGAPGRVVSSDLYLDPKAAQSVPLHHVSLDRFTQGPMDGLLFSEAPVRSGELPLDLTVDLRKLPPLAREALADALRDLACGRLPLGAAANRGHGYFRARDEDLKTIDAIRGASR